MPFYSDGPDSGVAMTRLQCQSSLRADTGPPPFCPDGELCLPGHTIVEAGTQKEGDTGALRKPLVVAIVMVGPSPAPTLHWG